MIKNQNGLHEVQIRLETRSGYGFFDKVSATTAEDAYNIARKAEQLNKTITNASKTPANLDAQQRIQGVIHDLNHILSPAFHANPDKDVGQTPVPESSPFKP